MDVARSRAPELSAAGTFRFLRSTGPSELFERSAGDAPEGPGLRLGEESTRLDAAPRGFGVAAIGFEIADEEAGGFTPLVRTIADRLSGVSESSLLEFEASSRVNRALLPVDWVSPGVGSESEADSTFVSTFTATAPWKVYSKERRRCERRSLRCHALHLDYDEPQ